MFQQTALEVHDMMIFPGDQVEVDLSFYGIAARATGTVLKITHLDCFHVKWSDEDVIALDIEFEWKWVLSTLVRRIVDGIAPFVPQKVDLRADMIDE